MVWRREWRERLTSGRANKNRISVNRKVATRCYREEPLQVESIGAGLGRKSIGWKELEDRPLGSGGLAWEGAAE